MKRFQKTLALLLALMTLLATISIPVFAATTYKVATMKTGTWYKAPYYSELKTVYKLKLTADSIVTVSWKGNKNGNLNVSLYDNKNGDGGSFFDLSFLENASGNETVALSKGTYYIQMYDWQEKPTSKVKITIKKAVHQTNYCRAKAIALKASQTVKIAQTADYSFDRWYKISVPKKKTVTITTNDDHADDIRLYDTRMNRIDCASGSTKVITEEKIPKGTYFICVSSSWINEYLGNYITLKWN